MMKAEVSHIKRRNSERLPESQSLQAEEEKAPAGDDIFHLPEDQQTYVTEGPDREALND